MALTNLLGDLTLEKTQQTLTYYIQQIAGFFSRIAPTPAGQLRVSIDAGTLPNVTTVATVNGVTTVSTVNTVTTVSTVSNNAASGGYNSQYDQYSLIYSNAMSVRNRITVT